MSINIHSIAQYSDQLELKYEVYPADNCLVTAFKGENINCLLIAIQILEEGRFIQFYTSPLFNIDESIYKGVALQTMLTLSHELKMLRFEYNRTEGTVRASIELPLEDNVLSFRQFQRCLRTLYEVVDLYAIPRLSAVLATGEDPGIRTKEEELAQWVANSNPETLAMLEQAIARRKEQET